MAKFLVHPFVRRIIGKFGELVVRKRRGEMFLSHAPEASTLPPTQGQLDVRHRFKLASVYANGVPDNPVLLAFYQAVASARETSVFSAAMSDFLKPPYIESIELLNYEGQIGGKIVIVAHDDAGAASVHVAIRDMAGVLLEQGQAMALNGAWTYTATTNLQPGQSVTIVATAKDRPGNSGSKEQPYQKL
jgi:hypothetical protein